MKVISQRPNKLLFSRDKFNKICRDLIGKFDEPIYNALILAGLSEQNIDVVILAGGSSAMPYVQEKIRKIFSSNKTKILFSPGIENIAQGLAVYEYVKELGIEVKKFEEEKEKKGTTTPQPKKKKKKLKKALIIVAVIALIIILAGAFFAIRYRFIEMGEKQASIELQLNQERQMRIRAEQQSSSPSPTSILGYGGAGATIGAAIGSFIPFAGTTVGAAIGGGLGLLYGVVSD